MFDPSQVDLSGLDGIADRLDQAARLDFTELMIEGARFLQEDNETSLREGLDCDGDPMLPTWRERNPEGFWFTRGSGPMRKRIRARGGLEAGSGPPLLPHGASSRAIADTQVAWTTSAPWESMLSWVGFDTDDGRPVLGLHADPPPGAPYPRRDIVSRPRPATVERFRDALRLFVHAALTPRA